MLPPPKNDATAKKGKSKLRLLFSGSRRGLQSHSDQSPEAIGSTSVKVDDYDGQRGLRLIAAMTSTNEIPDLSCMTLILIDQHLANFVDSQGLRHSFDVTEDVVLRADPSTMCQCTGSRLLAEIAVGNKADPFRFSSLKLTVTKTKTRLSDNSNNVNLSLRCDSSNANFNILKELQNRFQEKVRISVVIKSSNHHAKAYGINPPLVILSQKGLLINPVGYTCEHKDVQPNNAFLLGYGPMDVRVSAHIAKAALPEPVSQKTRMMLDMGLCSDVIIVAGNGVEIKAHKLFLAADSSVFRRMFETEMEEAKTGKVEMTDMTEDGVRAFLRYIYCSDLCDIKDNIGVAYELLYAGHKYDVSALEAKMISYLLQRNNEDFNAKSAFTIYSFARNVESVTALKDKMIGIMLAKFDKLQNLPEYNGLFKNRADSMKLCEDFVKAKLKVA